MATPMTKERKVISIHEKLDVIKQLERVCLNILRCTVSKISKLERSKRIPQYMPRSCLRDNVAKKMTVLS